MEYYDNDLKLIENPDLSDKTIEVRTVDEQTYFVLHDLTDEQKDARSAAIAKMVYAPTADENESAIAELGEYVTQLEGRIAELEGKDNG